jgi:hypothetical protein
MCVTSTSNQHSSGSVVSHQAGLQMHPAVASDTENILHPMYTLDHSLYLHDTRAVTDTQQATHLA